ncbi:MAG: ABC transporter ATP-binding protein [Microbacteriaceae bacterium]
MVKFEGRSVEACDLRARRGKREVLHGIDFSIPHGQLVGLLGPSGSGKSTLIRSLVGVQDRVTGRITVLGHPAGSAPLRSRVGYVTQDASVYADLTVRQNLRYFARILGCPRSDIDRVLEATGLADVAHARVGELSGGQRGRTSLAAALLGRPELLILDEPTVGLDPVLRVELWTLFRELAATGTTLLVSSHVMDEATRCDRLLLLRDGAILADLTPAELLSSTQQSDPESAFLTLIERGVS